MAGRQPEPPGRGADLHLHTCYSDGSRTPAELVHAARAAGLAIIAVTDHDTMAGVAPAQAAAAGELEVVAGVEMTGEVGGREIHVLGYFFESGWETAPLQQTLARGAQIREERVTEFVRRLNALGCAVTVADVRACAGSGTLGRPHVAQALVNRGHAGNIHEAFARFLRRGQPAYVERERLPAVTVINQIHAAGGVAVLAHPGLNRVDPEIPALAEQGLDGLEVWHPQHGPSQTEHYCDLAGRLGLLPSGGSDDHGPGRDPLLGTIRIAAARVDALRQARQVRC